MLNRLLKLSSVVVLAGVGLGLVQLRVQAADVPAGAVSDLDSYSDAQLERDLTDELNDIFASLPADEQFAIADLQEAILEAFSDDGDEGFEEEVDVEDLDDEMEEAGTTLGDVVSEAMERADKIAAREASPSWTLAHGQPSAHSPTFRFASVSLSLNAQNRNQRGFSTSRVAVQQTVRGTIASIRRAR